MTHTTGTRTSARAARQPLEPEVAVGSTDDVSSSMSTTSGVGHERARQAHALRLAAGEVARGARGTRPSGRRARARACRGSLELRLRGDLEVGAHRAGERCRALEDHADSSAKRERIDGADVVAAEPDRAARPRPRAGCSSAAASTSRSPTARRGRSRRRRGPHRCVREARWRRVVARDGDVLEGEEHGRGDAALSCSPARRAPTSGSREPLTRASTTAPRSRRSARAQARDDRDMIGRVDTDRR